MHLDYSMKADKHKNKAVSSTNNLNPDEEVGRITFNTHLYKILRFTSSVCGHKIP